MNRWVTLYLVLVYALGFPAAVGLLRGEGRWYTSADAYRQQVRALLEGRLALSDTPADLAHDLTWSEGGVHQVWGLGVPCWQAPFQMLARLLGHAILPDLIPFLVALGGAAWFCLRTCCPAHAGPPVGGTDSVRPGASALARWQAVGVIGLLLLFPPFVNLTASRFAIWEQAVAYEYLLGLVLIGGLCRIARQPDIRHFWGLCLVAGLAGLVRPTLVFHGAAAVLAAGSLIWLSRPPVLDGPPPLSRQPANVGGALAVGLGLYLAGGLVLGWTNHRRFGHSLEFGHRLNVQHLYGSLYSTRFEAPFEREPIGSAARELFGLLFLAGTRGTTHLFATQVVPGQSETLRFRELYLTTYDLSYCLLLAPAWVLAARCLGRLRSAPWGNGPWHGLPCREQTVPVALGMYSAVSTLLLLAFYLRCPVISSRYLLDLMPAFAAALFAGWLQWTGYWHNRRLGQGVLLVSAALLLGWLGWQLGRSGSRYGPPQVYTRAEMDARRSNAHRPAVVLPAAGAYSGPDEAGATRIPYNGAGWAADSGGLMPCVILFVDDPAYLELELLPVSGTVSESSPEVLRAKVGLEFLQRQSITRTDRGWRVRFSGPQQKRYQSGIQPVFIATVPPGLLASQTAFWRLERVSWRPAR